ncbi:hypothetical protein QJV44_gp14 [Serratia phage vB_SmaS_Tlacuache]|uniref:Uncharacterized protein n=1 Tax=Serratia phage vB_SmaS_Tlacuache TaxID=2894809 RepID=A0AAE8YVE1_9CAUD|nr:hypothetical protein QJV44_gp14 [Serratia phage vB_SmaS_Tlacuache]UGO51428.1 hypothetical protein TLACUACHE_14 [Serratia phage vB_SmaS_Tlacuache]
MWKQTGKKPKALDVPPLPETLFYLWECFLKLINDGWLSYQEIKAFIDLTGYELSGSDIEWIRRLDRIYWRVMNDH